MIPLPAWVDPEAWGGFVVMRKAMKRPFTDRAAKLILKELYKLHEAGHDANACLDQSTLKGWTDVYPVKDKPIEAKATTQTNAWLKEYESHKQASQSESAHEARSRCMALVKRG